ncbi:MAG: 2,5-diamino-6-(ribosylamino)-4(3H)-pyrimidinone 5'-phosphate reductase [Cirrosporium novae-zelandiae]|nr:MAG: 2,5-diamino-6-(ribosylamino)-4(3H)-pyrimidinone 5'-phosphate reductase [Cirrosporium novae-zelandiae]
MDGRATTSSEEPASIDQIMEDVDGTPSEIGSDHTPPANGSNDLATLPKDNAPLFNNPSDLRAIRQKLFEIKDKVEIRWEEWEKYWPYVDNIWVRSRSARSTEGQPEVSTEYYMCRLRRPTTKHREPSKDGSERQPLRRKKTREGGTCQMKIKVQRFDHVYPYYLITRLVGDGETHSHDLDHIDKIKRNSVVMGIARKESMKGYLPSSVYTVMREQWTKLDDAGGKFMTTMDIRNTSQHWRAAHPEVQLVPHDGYEFLNGQRIVKIPNYKGPTPADNDAIAQLEDAAQGVELPPDILRMPDFPLDFLDPYLPKPEEHTNRLPFVTLTYAMSMDSSLSLAPGVQTILSGKESKLMTHYLRSKHDAILVGVGTAVADDPGLNCRLENVSGYGGFGWEGQPRPVVIDPLGRWNITPESRILKIAAEGKGRAPWIIISPGSFVAPEKVTMLRKYGGDYVRLDDYNLHWRLRWEAILLALANEGIRSVMIEGGGNVINELLNQEYSSFIGSVIVTIAPTYLGRGGVFVSPDRRVDQAGRPRPAVRFHDVKWQPIGEDVIMCGRVQSTS